MKVGDVLKFKATGVIGTITEIVKRRKDCVFRIWVHGADFQRIQNPTMFRAGYLKEVAEVISAS
jgi:tRNA U34 5-methylaminomethyl-2-thiouridine-forming methyltransferase MnmC